MVNLKEYDRTARDKGITYKSPWSGRLLKPSVFPGSFSDRYDLCLLLPEYRHPEYSLQYPTRTLELVHEIYIHPEFIGFRSA